MSIYVSDCLTDLLTWGGFVEHQSQTKAYLTSGILVTPKAETKHKLMINSKLAYESQTKLK